MSGPKTLPRWRHAAILVALVTSACAATSTTTVESSVVPDTGAAVDRPEYGFQFSPRSPEPEDFEPFFEVAATAGTVMTWAGDWIELEAEGGAPGVLAQQAEDHGLDIVVIADFFNQGERLLLRPLDESNLDRYVSSATKFCEEFEPAYFGVGVEVDILFETSPENFDIFVGLFERTAAQVHESCPGTKVFTAFQLERLRGMLGGLYGGENDASLANWGLLGRFPAADLIAFTTYPNVVFPTPEDIPDDYYSEILSHTNKPIGFIESGWHVGDTVPGWEGSEDEQVAFVERLVAETEAIGAELLIWSFLYDTPAGGIFDSIGLISSDGDQRLGWDTWLEMTGR